VRSGERALPHGKMNRREYAPNETLPALLLYSAHKGVIADPSILAVLFGHLRSRRKY
jgi:hypothetical protein